MRTSQKLTLAFATLIAAGTAMLAVCPPPQGSSGPGLVDAFFTATSAVCVTGLTVRDTGTGFPVAGQAVILLLIQLGGLGMMTFSNLLMLAIRKKLDLSHRGEVSETFGSAQHLRPASLVRSVFVYTAAAELLGAALLYARFSQTVEPLKAAWLALFHSVSAFCNAGFSLFPDSLMAFRDDLFTNVVFMALIVAGGLGFIVAAELGHGFRCLLKKEPMRLSLHSRTTLLATACLIAGGTLVLLALESFGSLRSEPWHRALLPSLFLSVTSRTAGFNTTDTSQLTNVSLLVVIFLMVVGASPGSCGGGIKTTTFAVMWCMVRSRVLNHRDTELFNRRISPAITTKALATTGGFLATAFLALTLLQLIEYGSTPHTELRGVFLEHLFEVISALGTVGLSTGVSPNLSGGGKLVVIACMFIGRIGPLIVADSLIGARKPCTYRLPEESVMIG